MNRPVYSKMEHYFLPLIGLGIYVISLILLILVFGKATGLIFVSAVFFFLGLLLTGSFLKTRNFPSLIIGLALILCSIFQLKNFLLFIFFLIPPIFAKISSRVPVISKFGSWDIFYPFNLTALEMAARNVNSVMDGYTARPYPLGKTDFKKKELVKFAKFLQKNLVATAYVEKERLILVFGQRFFGYIPFLKPKLENRTYASVSFSGEISVTIAKKDYDRYNFPLTFDQLCNSFGNVLLELLEIYLKGEGSRIIHILKEYSMPPGPFYNDTFLDLQSVIPPKFGSDPKSKKELNQEKEQG
ncbi:MAG: hypothetical protein PVH61_21250 [Candidatus Aminicenantes bacterium]